MSFSDVADVLCRSSNCKTHISMASRGLHSLVGPLLAGSLDEQQAVLELNCRVCRNVRSVCFLNMWLMKGRSYAWLLCFCCHALLSSQSSMGCIKASLLPCYATSRCLEAVHACIQNTEQLPGHTGAQLPSRRLDVVLWTSWQAHQGQQVGLKRPYGCHVHRWSKS